VVKKPINLDRSLPVPLGVQLRGWVEYGIVCGELLPGDRLPSVREMAGQLGIAPMTVAAVYRELQDAALIEARPGFGTFVTRNATPNSNKQRGIRELESRLMAWLQDGAALGVDRTTLVMMFNTRLGAAAPPIGLRIVFVGLFETATDDYAAAIATRLPAGDRIAATTLDLLRDHEDTRHSVLAADLVLTIVNRRSEVAALLGRAAPPLATVSFLPAETVRARLAAIDPFARVVVVSLFPAWLAIMTAGVRRFASHVPHVTATLLDAPDLAAILGEAETVIYATGAETVLGALPHGATAIEYRHVPNLREIDGRILPLLDTLRRPATKTDQEIACASPI
jgi:DNA-binding transcriptional regulator YhcF (GntR family)